MATRTARPGEKTSPPQHGHGPHRIVVLAGEPIRDRALVEEIARHAQVPRTSSLRARPEVRKPITQVLVDQVEALARGSFTVAYQEGA
jgi:hypothetical protein